MPLSPPAPRELQHSRAITIHGYQRADGLYDIEAELVDTKTYGFPNHHRGYIAPGEKLHHMWLRLTINDDMEIVTSEAVTEAGPYRMCPAAAPNFARLQGLKIGKGFLRAANERVGRTVGCTHLRELLQQMATTAFQTTFPTRVRREAEAAKKSLPPGDGYDTRVTEHFGGPPAVLNSCLAYADDGPLVQRRWPDFYKGPAGPRQD
ncbi:MAG: DUF2889 domain-containing protein [Acetobacteraceae bacterium]|nr:DUF2889 domain-containing protein [Acetobacteraceae bacterium]